MPQIQLVGKSNTNLPEDPIPSESPIRLEERNAVDEHCHRSQPGNDFSIHPFAIGVGARLAGTVEIDTVQAGDGDSEHELEEPKDKSDQCSHHASAARAVAQKVESTHFAGVVCLECLIEVVELWLGFIAYIMLAGVICASWSLLESAFAMQGMFVLTMAAD